LLLCYHHFFDSSFGINGKVASNFATIGYYSNWVEPVAIQTDGKFFIASTLGSENYKTPFVLARYNVNGSLDSSFGITDVKVNYTTKDGNAHAGSDYTASSGTVIIRAGKLSKNVVISVIGDNTRESNERFTLVLSNPGNAILGTLDSAACIIKNDDPSFALSQSSVNDISFNNAKISIHPNPATDVINIQGLDKSKNTTVSLLDMQGHLLMKDNVTGREHSFNIKSLVPGVYIIRIERGDDPIVYKIIKE